LLPAHVLNEVAVVGELRADVPTDAASPEDLIRSGELVAPRLHSADVHDLIAGETSRRRQRHVDDRVGHLTREVRVRHVRTPAKARRLEARLELHAAFRFELRITERLRNETRLVREARARRVELLRVEGSGLRARGAVRGAESQIADDVAQARELLFPERLFADDPRAADLRIVRRLI